MAFYKQDRNSGLGAVLMSQQDWYTSVYQAGIEDVDALVNKLVFNVSWLRTPQFDYWMGDGTFVPALSTGGSASQIATSFEGDIPVGA